jgi:CheY-like chemotaxis protein
MGQIDMLIHPHDWRVLVVEDQDDSVQVVSQILEHYGIEVHVAGNGRECLEMLPGVRPTLVITDLAMPEMDGWQMLSELRSHPKTADLIVVAITAFHSVNVAEDALAAGFDAYFAKPIAAASFVDELAALVDQLS